MANRTIEAVLRLSSKLGSMRAFRSLGGNLDKVNRKAKAFNRSQSMIVAGSKNMNAALLRYAAPAAVAAGVAATVKSFGSIERRMNRIGITADASADETTAALDRVRQIADDIRGPVQGVVDGLDSLTASGKTMREALELLPAVSSAAQAADADFADMATTADAIANSFNIAGTEMERAFDIVAKGGKEGKFELKDMASHLPSLAPAFAALGYEGEAGLKRLVAALQTVRLETGTSGEAATAFMDVMTKMESSAITNNFKKFGVSIRKELAEARRSGEDILDAFLRLSKEAVNGDLSKLPQLFTDKQMLIAMRALMRNTEELKNYEAAMSKAAGTVSRDLDRLAADTQSKLDQVGNSWRRLKENIGGGLIDLGVGTAMDAVTEDLGRGSGIRKGLEKRGMGYWEREAFILKNRFFNEDALDQAAWQGGYRSEDERKAIRAYGDYAKGRGSAGQTSAPNLPTSSTVPVPTPRPPAAVPTVPRLAASAPAAPAPTPRYSQISSAPDPERFGPPAPEIASVPNPARFGRVDTSSASAAGGAADAIDRAMKAGADHAADKISNGGQAAGERLGDSAAEKLMAVARDAGAAFGNAAADLIRSAARGTSHVPARDVGRDVAGTGDL